MQPILALWTTPRSTSTAFELMMRQRGDLEVAHEPFARDYYYGSNRRCTRPATVDPKPEHLFSAICCQLKEQAERRPLFLKDMAYHVRHHIGEPLLKTMLHSFLIRDPAKALPSLFARMPDFSYEEAGYEALEEMVDYATTLSGKAPVVIDSDDLISHPSALVEAWCKALDIPFMAAALNWQAGLPKEMVYWEEGTWHKHLQATTGFQEQQNRNYPSVDEEPRLKAAYERCQPIYARLRALKLQLC